MSGILGFTLASLTALFKSSSEIISKRNLNTDIGPYTNAWALRAFALPLILVALAIVGIPSLNEGFYLAVAVSSPISIIGTVLYMKGLEASDISIISPLSALSPLLLLISTPLIVNEFPSAIGLVGVIITTLGVYLLELSKKEDGLLAPIKAISREPGAKYIVGMLILYSISSPVDKIGVEAASPIMYTASLHFVTVLGLTPLVYFKGEDKISELSNKNVGSIATIGFLSGLSSIAQMMALTYTLVIYVIAVKRAGVLISVAAGGIFFDEPYTRQRLIGTIVILIGLVLITLSLA